jgi:hypothetical protein
MKWDLDRIFGKFARKKKEEQPTVIVIPDGSPFILSEDGKSVFFGHYPQSVCLDSKEVNVLPDQNGYSTLPDGTEVVLCETQKDLTASNGLHLVTSQKYYFKMDAVEWEILKYENGEALLLSKYVLDAKAFNDGELRQGDRKDAHGYETRLAISSYGLIPANNWEISTLREWLNWDFKSLCFNDEELERLIPFDRGASVEKGENYSDEVSLLSVEEASSSDYGFLPSGEKDPKRSAIATDYAIANGVETVEVARELKCVWWLRSPGFTTYNASRVYYDGYLNESGKKTDNEGFGIRPLIKVKF